MSYTYLAQPYSHPSKLVRDLRVQLAREYLRSRSGSVIYSPILHNQNWAGEDEDAGFEFFVDHDFTMLKSASALVVLRIPGWEDSRGVSMETAFARALSIPVDRINANSLPSFQEHEKIFKKWEKEQHNLKMNRVQEELLNRSQAQNFQNLPTQSLGQMSTKGNIAQVATPFANLFGKKD